MADDSYYEAAPPDYKNSVSITGTFVVGTLDGKPFTAPVYADPDGFLRIRMPKLRKRVESTTTDDEDTERHEEMMGHPDSDGHGGLDGG